MFTIEQINEAHSKVKSGADFPKYIQDLTALNILNYTIFVHDGHAEYVGKDHFILKSEATYSSLIVVDKSDIEYFKQRLKIHQQGQTDYRTFCKDAAACGVKKWIVDMRKMTCTYYDKTENKMVEEKIPQPK